MDRKPLASMLRAKLAAGQLPLDQSSRLWARQGSGSPCCVCDDPILPAQAEYEFDDAARGLTYRFHVGGFGLWEAERVRRGVRNRRHESAS